MAELWHDLGQGIHALLLNHPLSAIFLLIFVEEVGIPTPIPGDLMMLFAGIEVAHGRVPLGLVLLVEEVATILGAVGLFLFSRGAGRRLILRYGRWLHVGPATLARARGASERWGGWAIVAGRIFPGLRIATPIAAGVLNVPLALFVPAVAAGGFVYLLGLTLLGLFLGPAALGLFDRALSLFNGLLSLVALIVLLAVVIRLRRSVPVVESAEGGRELLTALGAGLVAGVAGLLAADAAIGGIGVGAHLLLLRGIEVARISSNTLEVMTGHHLLFGWPLFLALVVVLGPVAVLLCRAGLPLAAAVSLAAIVPLLSAVPLVDREDLRLSGAHTTQRIVLLLTVELIRSIVFGLTLGLLLPLAQGKPSRAAVSGTEGHAEPQDRRRAGSE